MLRHKFAEASDIIEEMHTRYDRHHKVYSYNVLQTHLI